MTKNDPRPFAGRKLTRKERRESLRRSKERAESLARAMPPPEQVERVDPITGKPLYLAPTPSPATPGPEAPSRGRPAAPGPFSSTPQAPVMAAPVAPTPGRAAPLPPTPFPPAPVPSTGGSPDKRGRGLRRSARPAPDPKIPNRRTPRARRRGEPTAISELPSLGDAFARAATPSLGARLLAPTPAPRAPWVYLAGLLLVVLGVMVAVGGGLPVLRHGWDASLLGVGVGALGFGAYGTRIGFDHTLLKVRIGGGAVAALLVASFVAGVASDPVIIDGRVLLSTSKEAKSVRLADQIYDDLRVAAGYDDLLAAPLEDARANVGDYEPAQKALAELWAKYYNLDPATLSDPSFAEVVKSAKSTFYWGSQAMTTKIGLIEQDDAAAESTLETQRASFTENWLTTATALKQVTGALGIPYTTDLEGPHE